MPPGLLETALPAPQDPDARASADTLLPGRRPPAAATHGRFVPRPPSAPNPRRPVRKPPRPATKLCQGKSRLCAQRGPGPSAHSPAICPHRRGPRGPHTAGPDVVVCSSAPPRARAPPRCLEGEDASSSISHTQNPSCRQPLRPHPASHGATTPPPAPGTDGPIYPCSLLPTEGNSKPLRRPPPPSASSSLVSSPSLWNRFFCVKKNNHFSSM